MELECALIFDKNQPVDNVDEKLSSTAQAVTSGKDESRVYVYRRKICSNPVLFYGIVLERSFKHD